MGSRLCTSTVDGSAHSDSIPGEGCSAANTLSVGGLEVQSPSFESLKDVMDCLLEQEQEVVKIVLEKGKESDKNKELFDVVENYFNEYLRAVEFCSNLEACLKLARDGHLSMINALDRFKIEATSQNNYQSKLEEINDFKNPFTKDFVDMFCSIQRRQISIFKNMRVRRKRLKKKLKHICAWRKVCRISFLVSFGALLVCSVVAAAVSAPPVASALAAATSNSIGSMGEWVNKLWKSYENVLKSKRKVFKAMQVGSYVFIKDLDHIRVMVDKLCIEIENFMKNTILVVAEPATLKLAIGEMKKNMEVLMKSIYDLGAQSDICKRDIKKGQECDFA